MTIDEAKAVFLNRGYVEVEGGTIYDADKWRESCRVISEWLEQEPCDDCISRQAVQDYIAKYLSQYLYDDVREAVEVIDEYIGELPSVKPQEPCDVPDINDGDIISKQTVLDTISELNAISFYEAQEDSKECYCEIRHAIEDLSPVKLQEPTGHWVKGKCDQCGGHAPFWSMATTYYESEYCPKCGARMEVEQNG